MTIPPKSGVWIVIGDIHDSTGNFSRIPELGEASGVIISGDLTNCGGKDSAARVMQAIASRGLPVYAQIGNMDLPEVNDWLEKQGHNLHGHTWELAPGVAIFGIGGSTYTPMHTPSEFSEEEYAAWLAKEWEEAGKYPHRVLISHNPPKDTLCDDIGGNVHVGSTAVRKFIETNQPDVCICGHIHEGRGTDRIGATPVINPGQLSEGGYVVLRLDNGALKAELRQVAI